MIDTLNSFSPFKKPGTNRLVEYIYIIHLGVEV